MQANTNVPWDTRESTPVERILDLALNESSSSKQESPGISHGECHSENERLRAALEGTETIEYMSGGLADENAELLSRLEDMTQKHESLIDALTGGLLSKAGTTNEAVVKVAEERFEELCLRDLLPKDSEGQTLDIADTVHMLRSEYNGDHEWEDVVRELVWCKYGGDKWIVRGARGEAWACDCTKTGHDDELYDESDDQAYLDIPIGWSEEFSELKKENDKMRELAKDLLFCSHKGGDCLRCSHGRFCDLRLDERCRELQVPTNA